MSGLTPAFPEVHRATFGFQEQLAPLSRAAPLPGTPFPFPVLWAAEVGSAVTESGLQAVTEALAKDLMSWIFL